MKNVDKVQQNVAVKVKEPEVRIDDINNVLATAKGNCEPDVKSALDKFFTDSNASMMGGWT